MDISGASISADMKKKLTTAGYRVEFETLFCKQFRETHDNCKGCESEVGCRKQAELMMILATSLIAKHDTPQQIMDNTKWMANKMKEIIDVEDSTL